MFFGIVVTTILFLTIYKKNKELEKIEIKTLYIHGLLLWIFLMMFVASFRMLGWTLANFNDVEKLFYINIGLIPDWLNLFMWMLNLFFGIIAVYLIFSMAHRKEKARKIFIKLLPIFYMITSYEVFKGFYEATLLEASEISFFFIISLSLLVSLIPYGIMYYFYRKKSIKDTIFVVCSAPPLSCPNCPKLPWAKK